MLSEQDGKIMGMPARKWWYTLFVLILTMLEALAVILGNWSGAIWLILLLMYLKGVRERGY